MSTARAACGWAAAEVEAQGEALSKHVRARMPDGVLQVAGSRGPAAAAGSSCNSGF